MRPSVLAAAFLALAAVPAAWAAQSGYGIYYGTSAVRAAPSMAGGVAIVQPYNFDLYKSYAGTKACYLSVGEYDGTRAGLGADGLAGAMLSHNDEWDSWVMDFTNPTWRAYLLKRADELKAQGCGGLFLDTLWRDGSQAGVVETVAALRARWPSGYFVANLAPDSLETMSASVDGYLFENFLAVGATQGDRDWTRGILDRLAKLKAAGKDVFLLSYGNPSAARLASILTFSGRAYPVVFSNRNIDRTYATWAPPVQAVAKPPAKKTPQPRRR